jgi:hypothetical protein
MTKSQAMAKARKNSKDSTRFVVEYLPGIFAVCRSVCWELDDVVAVFEDGEYFHPEEC